MPGGASYWVRRGGAKAGIQASWACKGHVAFDLFFGIEDGLDAGEELAFAGAGTEKFAEFGEAAGFRDRGHEFTFDPEDGFALAGERGDLAGVRDAGLVTKPFAGREGDEEDDDGAHDVVLPDAALIVPQNEALEAR